MKKLFVLLGLISMIMLGGCGSKQKPAASTDEMVNTDSILAPQRQDPKRIPYIFSGDLSKYYFVRMCTITPLSKKELEAMNVTAEPDHHYYIASVGLVRNGVPFDFPVDQIECLYDMWFVPAKFPDGKFNVHAQLVDSHHVRVGELDFSDAVELKDLLRKCPGEGDYMVIEDLLDVERYFDHPSNTLDIRGYIKPVKE
ncbi:MAG: hypothetical protein IKX59_00475 [Bacteroidales bacterium]|nr:hypothetical protein [Bacteroidales bacterium]